MQDLAVLTPPLLVCAVVIIAIVAFLRHEMGRSRPDQSAPGDEISASADTPDADPDSDQYGTPTAPYAPGADRDPGP